MTGIGSWRTVAFSGLLVIAAISLQSFGRGLGPNNASASPSSAVNVEVLATGLEVPWAVDFAPDGRALITERPGRIRVFSDGHIQDGVWAAPEVVSVSEAGLLGLAIDPDFATNHRVYVALSYRLPNGGHANRLVRMHEENGKGIMDAVLLDGVMGSTQHDGGRVRIGPDSMIYWTTGDSGNGDLSQDVRSLNGKILRVNLDGSIPSDNPIPGSPIYSYGHRNPQGLAWQPGTQDLYATEHGPSGNPDCCQDEVNRILPGQNYGWPVITAEETREGLVSPVWQSGLSETWAPSGAAFVTQGPWEGSLLFTGLRGESLYRLVFDPAAPSRPVSLEGYLKEQFGRLRDVAQGPDGAFYVLTNNRDAFGSPTREDDRLLRVAVE
jgi:aldose sugar dehydrogenase